MKRGKETVKAKEAIQNLLKRQKPRGRNIQHNSPVLTHLLITLHLSGLIQPYINYNQKGRV